MFKVLHVDSCSTREKKANISPAYSRCWSLKWNDYPKWRWMGLHCVAEGRDVNLVVLCITHIMHIVHTVCPLQRALPSDISGAVHPDKNVKCSVWEDALGESRALAWLACLTASCWAAWLQLLVCVSSHLVWAGLSIACQLECPMALPHWRAACSHVSLLSPAIASQLRAEAGTHPGDPSYKVMPSFIAYFIGRKNW